MKFRRSYKGYIVRNSYIAAGFAMGCLQTVVTSKPPLVDWGMSGVYILGIWIMLMAMVVFDMIKFHAFVEVMRRRGYDNPVSWVYTVYCSALPIEKIPDFSEVLVLPGFSRGMDAEDFINGLRKIGNPSENSVSQQF